MNSRGTSRDVSCIFFLDFIIDVGVHLRKMLLSLVLGDLWMVPVIAGWEQRRRPSVGSPVLENCGGTASVK